MELHDLTPDVKSFLGVSYGRSYGGRLQNKSKSGIATPKPDLEMIQRRLKLAQQDAENDDD